MRRQLGDLVAQAIQLGNWLNGGTKVGILYTPIFERSWRLEDTRSRGDPDFFKPAGDLSLSESAQAATSGVCEGRQDRRRVRRSRPSSGIFSERFERRGRGGEQRDRRAVSAIGRIRDWTLTRRRCSVKLAAPAIGYPLVISSRYHQGGGRVAQVVIRNIDEEAMRRLKARAARKGVSLERELRTILTDAARTDRTGFGERAAVFRRKLAGRRHSDSTRLIRKDRDR